MKIRIFSRILLIAGLVLPLAGGYYAFADGRGDAAGAAPAPAEGKILAAADGEREVRP